MMPTSKPHPWIITIVWAVAINPAVWAVPPSIIRAIDRDAAAVYFGYAGTPDETKESSGDSLQMATTLIDHLDRMGLLSRVDVSIRYWIDILTALNDIKHHPHAVVLYHIDASPRDDGGHDLARMMAALVVHTDGHNTRIEQRIQHLLNHYTNTEESTLSTASDEMGTVYTLRNKKLPKWAMIKWGAVGPYYVVSIGKGVFERTKNAINQPMQTLVADPWFGRAFSSTQGTDALLGWFIRFDTLQSNADPLLAVKIQKVQTSLGLQDVQRGLWMVRSDLRAVHLTGYIRRQEKDKLQHYSNTGLTQPFTQNRIPDQASHYTVLDIDPHGVLVGLNEAYLATRSPGAQRRCEEFWQKVQNGANVSLEKDIYAHLDRPVIIHNYPRHAFSLPLAWTLLIRIKDDPDTLRTRVDQLMDYISREMMQDRLVQLKRDEDGVWYLFAGILGPALKVTDHWLIISFSPVAVRQNISLWSGKQSIKLSPAPEQE